MQSRSKQAGYSLVQLIICILVIALVAAVVFPNLGGRGRRRDILEAAMSRVLSRRAEARRLAPLSARTSQEDFTQPPVAIDFTVASRTAPLRVEGDDANNDFNDDTTGLPLTRYDAATGKWSYAYEGTALDFPEGWRLAPSSSGLPAGVPPITTPGGDVQGIPVGAVGFDAGGDAWGDADGDGVPESSPTSLAATAPQNAESPFWALYFTEGETAGAVAVHATGLVEVWTYTPDGWRGRANRTPGN